MTTYKKNHTLSARLLERFANNEAKVVRSDVATNTSILRPTTSQGFEKGLWRITSKKFMEELWSDQAEEEMRKVFDRLDAGRGLTLAQKNVVVRYLTVHFIRSTRFIKVYDEVRAARCETQRFDPQLNFSERYHLRLKVLCDTEIPCALFEEQMKHYYEKCLKYLSGFGLEIGTATGNESFTLPDSGMFLADFTDQQAPSINVPVLQATNAVMPLGPKHIAAFTSRAPKLTYRQWSDAEVRRGNTHLRSVAIKAYYSLPSDASSQELSG